MSYERDLVEALNELERVWITAGDVQTVTSLKPGVSSDAVTDVWRDLVWPLPSEALVWWGWHNGGQPGRGPAIGGSHLEFLDLDEARRQYDLMVSLSLEVSQKQPDAMSDVDFFATGYHPAWIPIAVGLGGDLVTLDCRIHDGVSPVRSTSAGDADSAKVDAESLLSVVRGWLTMYAEGIYAWDGERWSVPQLKRIPRAMHPFW